LIDVHATGPIVYGPAGLVSWEWDKHRDCPTEACHFIFTMWQRCLYSMDWMHTTAMLNIHSMYSALTQLTVNS